MQTDWLTDGLTNQPTNSMAYSPSQDASSLSKPTYSLHFMQPVGSFLSLQEPVTCPCSPILLLQYSLQYYPPIYL
jgi:hypothetical protein